MLWVGGYTFQIKILKKSQKVYPPPRGWRGAIDIEQQIVNKVYHNSFYYLAIQREHGQPTVELNFCDIKYIRLANILTSLAHTNQLKVSIKIIYFIFQKRHI